MTFDEVLRRAGDTTVQTLIGGPALRLLQALDPKLATPANLKKLLVELTPPAQILRTPSMRREVLDLLRPAEARDLAARLGLRNDRDPFAALAEAKISKGSKREAELFGALGVISPVESGPIAIQQPSTREIEPDYALFDHQRIAAAEVIRLLRLEPYRVVLHMPTGAGKTRTAINIIARRLNDFAPSVVCWLAYSEELCEQAACEFEVAWRYLGNRSLRLHRFWGSHQLDVNAITDGFLVAGLGKVYSGAKSDLNFIARLGDKAELVIIDEAHQAVAPTYQFVLEALTAKQPKTALLGLTATPGRTWNDLDEDRRLSDFFGRHKVGLDIPGYKNPVEYLIKEGYLARPVFSALDSGVSFTSAELLELMDSLDIPARTLERLANDEVRNLRIVVKLEELARRHKRILLFAATVRHANLLATILRARGHVADSITSNTDEMTRALVINKYRSSAADPMILCNYGVLTAGFDAPRTSAAVIARPTTSLVLYSQMVGRATRGPRAGGNEEAEIVTVIDEGLPGFRDMAEAFMNWEDVWRE